MVVPVTIASRVRTHLPALARHIENSRAVGRLAVDHGVARASTFASERLPGACNDAKSPPGDSEAASPLPAVTAPHAGTTPADVPEPPPAIADYASLAASQVVPRLSALNPDELAEVEAYESATRRRRTILSAIDRLSS